MYTPRQILQHVTPKAQLLIALSLATALAFGTGLAAGIYGRATYLPTLTTDRNAVPAVAQPPQAAPAVQQPPAVAASRNPNVPISGTGSAYDGRSYRTQPYVLTRPANMPSDGSAYVGYLIRRAAAPHNPNVPISGTGSAYDGDHYTSAPVVRNPNVPISGTGSAYDGDHYTSAPVVRNPNVPISGTGSAYDGGHQRLENTTPLAPVNPKQPAVLARFADSAQQGVAGYLRAHRAAELTLLDPAQQGVLDYLRAHGQ